MRDEFDRRRKAVVAGLNQLPGVRAATPKRAFYAFPNIAADRLEGQAPRLGLAAGSGRRDDRRPRFRHPQRGVLKLSYANSLENIEHALNHMQDFPSPARAEGVEAVRGCFMNFPSAKRMFHSTFCSRTAAAIASGRVGARG